MSENATMYTVCFSGLLAGDWPAPPCVAARVESRDPRGRPTTTLTLKISAQDQLMGILNQLNSLGLSLLSVRDRSAVWAQGEAQTTWRTDAGATGAQQ